MEWPKIDVVIELHSAAEVDAEVERLRAELPALIERWEVRPGMLEEDLRRVAYGRLTERKFMWPMFW